MKPRKTVKLELLFMQVMDSIGPVAPKKEGRLREGQNLLG